MKTFKLNRPAIMTTALAVVISVVLATQSTVASVSAQMATDTNKKQLDSLLQNINKELERRQTVLDKSSLDKTSTGTPTDDTKECNTEDVPKSVTDGAKNDASKTGNSMQSLQDSLKGITNLGDAQQKAKQTDDSYQQFQVAATKSAIVKDMCTQSDAKQQLEELVKQAKEKMASNESSGQSNGNSEEQTKMIEQLITAIEAIFASVVALIIALATGNYEAAMQIFQTILGQLAVVGTILLQAVASMVQINLSLDAGGSS